MAALDARDLRAGGLVLLGLGALLPFLPAHAGIVCPLRALTGIPCPLCGMTTSVEDSLRLDLGGAITANPAGMLAVAVAIAMLARRPEALHVGTRGVVCLVSMMWLYELFRFGFL